MAATAVIGRDEAIGSIRAFIAAVERGPMALVLSGEAGIGKTVLWEEGVAEAERRFDRVLTCRGIEAEAALSFSGLSDLLWDVVGDVAPLLLPLRRRALEVALLLAEPDDDAPDARAIGVAFLDVLRVLAERGPVLVAIDDLQWLDGPSAGAFGLALRRLRTERVGLLATVREAPEVIVPFELDRMLPDGRLRRVALGPLGIGALHRLLRGRIGLELARPEVTRVGEASGGNPFFALEIGRELAHTDVALESERPLPVPHSLSTLLGKRLERLPRETREILLVAALAGRPTADMIARAYGERENALAALELAAREGVVVLEGSRVRFSHPLFGSVCYEEAPVWRRQAVHRLLAEVVADPEERARHLALSTDRPDPAIASELDAATEHAAARGATAAAAGLAELAVAMTPSESREERRRRRFSAAWFHRFAGDFERACAIFEQLLAEIPSGVERSDVLYALATTGRADLPTRIRLCGEAAKEAAGDDLRLVPILGFRAISRWVHGDVPGALVDARGGLERAERVGDSPLLATAISRVGLIEMWALESTPGLLERGVAIEDSLERPLLFHDSPRLMLAIQLITQDELDRARDLLETLERDAVARGDEHARAWAVLQMIFRDWHAGQWGPALEHAAVALELAEQTGEVQYAGMACAFTAWVQADAGLVEEARATARRGLACAEEMGDEVFTVFNLGALGAVELALGDIEEADRYLHGLPSRLLSAGYRQPGTVDVWPNTIETLIALGELDQARAYLTQYEALAALASRRTRGSAARCEGLLATANGDVAAAFAAFDRSTAELGTGQYPVERARTLLALGSVHRQAKHKRLSREALDGALAIFDGLGAPLWAEKARAELRRISGRRPASDELSETEQRVAALAAEGRSNKEIAAELYASVRTVEAHLSHIYRKLGVRSRAELTRRLITVEGSAKAAGQAAKVQ
jgi:DNA-binding CsgD family transcriptional regulator